MFALILYFLGYNSPRIQRLHRINDSTSFEHNHGFRQNYCARQWRNCRASITWHFVEKQIICILLNGQGRRFSVKTDRFPLFTTTKKCSL
jgi:hypothetical protein